MQRSTAASLTQAVWWLQVVGSGPWWCRWPAFLRAFSAVGLSGKGWCRAELASGPLCHGCTPALEPPPHSGAPGSPSGTRRYVAGCRSLGSGRGAGSQLKREHRWRSSFQQVMLEHVPPSQPVWRSSNRNGFPATALGLTLNWFNQGAISFTSQPFLSFPFSRAWRGCHVQFLSSL